MRAVTAGEQTVLLGAHRKHLLRVEVENAAGVYQDLSALAGSDFQVSAQITQDVDNPIAEIRVTLWREKGSASLSPFMAGSTVNSGGAAIDAGRGIRVYAATLAPGASPGASDWKKIAEGEIDVVDPTKAELVIIARDGAGYVVDRFVELETEYGSDPGTAIELVMQDILDDWAPGVTLWVPVSPGFLVQRYIQQVESVWSALRTLAGSIGWDVRMEWDDVTQSFRLKFFEPDRTATVPVWTFASNRYFDIPELKIDREDVRNVVEISYLDSTTGQRTKLTSTDAASVARFGRRWMQIFEADDSPISTASEAQALADAALSDLAFPIADKQAELPFFWPVQMGDLLRFAANGVHYDAAMDLAVTGIKHELGPNRERTSITLRGKPAGYYKTWRRPLRPEEIPPLITWYPIAATQPGREAVRFVVTDEGDTARLYFRVYTAGSPPPAYSTTAFAPTPFEVPIEVDKPLEGAPHNVIEVYAEDIAGNLSEGVLRIEIDGDAEPTGFIQVEVNQKTGDTVVIVNTVDSDTGSARVRLTKGLAGTNAFVDPDFSAADDAIAPGAFGSELAGPNLKDGEALYVSGYFFRTLATDAASQQASIKSRITRALGYCGRNLNTAGQNSAGGPLVTAALALSGSTAKLTINRMGFNAGKSIAVQTSIGTPISSPSLAAATAFNLTPYLLTEVFDVAALTAGQVLFVYVWICSELDKTGNATPVSLVPNSVTHPGAGGQTLALDVMDTAHWTDPGADITITVRGGNGNGGTLEAWVNHDSPDNPNFGGPADGSFAVAGPLPQIVSFNTWALLLGIATEFGKPKTVRFRFTQTGGGTVTQDITLAAVQIPWGPPRSGAILTPRWTFNLQVQADPASRPSGGAPSLASVLTNITDLSHLAAAAQVSTGVAANRMYAKGLASDPNDLGSIADSLSYGKVLQTALTGSTVDLSKAGVVNKSGTYISRSTADPTGINTILQNVTNAGHLNAAMQVSTGTAANRMYAKQLSSDPNDLGSILDSLAYRKTSITDVTTAGRVLQAQLQRVDDTRATNEPPSWYPMGVTREFKERVAIGAPGSTQYGELETVKPWTDSSGGHATQIFKSSDGEFVRTGGAGGATWGAWHYVIESQSQRISRTSGHLDSTMQISTGAAANRMYVKALSSDTDDADSIAPGAGKRVTTNNEATGAGRAFSALDAANALISGVARSAYIGNNTLNTAFMVQKRHGIFFAEEFENLLSDWLSADSGASYALDSTIGKSTYGRRVLVASAGQMWRVFPDYIPFNPSKLYRLRVRFRVTAGSGQTYIGLQCIRSDFSGANNDSGYNYCVRAAETYDATAGWQEITTWVKGATRPSSSPSSTYSEDPLAPVAMNVDTVYVRPVLAFNYGVSSGGATWELDYFTIEELDEDAEARIYGIATPAADLQDGVGQADGVTTRPLVRGYREGLCEGGVVSAGAWSDGTPITFPENFDAPPVVLLEGGLPMEFRSEKWTNGYDPHKGTYPDVQALNVTASGFTPRARLVQTGDLTFTSRQDNFPANSLDVVGESVQVSLANAPAHDDKYKISLTFSGEVFGNPASGPPQWLADFEDYINIEVAIDTSADGGSTWVERARLTMGHQDNANTTSTWSHTVELLVSGLSNTVPVDQVRVRCTAINKGSSSATGHITANNVQYSTATGIVSYASKTPDQAANPNDRIKYRAMVVA